MANRYWVGGTAAWDGTAGTKWALTSGGAGGQAVPTSADDVFFSSLSTGTCTISAGNTGAKSITCTGFTGTLAGTATISVAGSVLLVAGMTFTYTGTITLTATGTLTSGGKSFGSVTVNGSGITVTLGDALTLGTTNTFTLTQGTIALNGFTLSTGIFSSSGSNTRAITFGTANIALTSTTAATTVLSMATATNFTYTGTGGFTRVQNATATVAVGQTGGTSSNSPNFTITSGASQLSITGANNLKAFTLTGSTCSIVGSATLHGNLTLASGGTYTSFSPTLAATQTFNSLGKTLNTFGVNGSGITVTLGAALTASGTSTLTQGTLNLNGFTFSSGRFNSSGTNVRAITFGSANIALTIGFDIGTPVLDIANATNFTYTGTGAFTRNQTNSDTVTFGTTGGSTTNAPNLTVNAGASALTITANSWFKNLSFTGNTSTITSTNVNMAGSLTLASGGTYTAVAPTYRATGTIFFTGKTLSALTVNGSGITVTCNGALTVTNALTLTLGKLRLQIGVTSTVGSIVTTGTTLKFLESSTSGSQATISDSSGTNTVSYLSIKDSNATGGAIFDASDPTNVNAGNNTGWIFPPASTGNFLTFFM